MLTWTFTESGDVRMHGKLAAGIKRIPEALEVVGTRQAVVCAERIRQRPTYKQPLSGQGPHLSVPGTAGGIISSLRGSLELLIGSDRPHAAIQQEGGTITPVTGKALAIPATERLRKLGLWPRDIDPDRSQMEFIPAKKKSGGLIGFLVAKRKVLKSGKQSKRAGKVRGAASKTAFNRAREVLFRLVSRVRIKSQPYLYWTEQDVGEAAEMIMEGIQK